MNIRKFAKMNYLNLLVIKRDDESDISKKYYAHFKHSDIKEGVFLIGEYGNGATKQEAIENYVKIMRGKLLVVYDKKRREINVPEDLEY